VIYQAGSENLHAGRAHASTQSELYGGKVRTSRLGSWSARQIPESLKLPAAARIHSFFAAMKLIDRQPFVSLQEKKFLNTSCQSSYLPGKQQRLFNQPCCLGAVTLRK
jgi:hypothetical protein